MRRLLLLVPIAVCAAPPTISGLQPRGAQKGRPFTLTLSGRDLVDVVRVHSTLPAQFTPLVPETPPGSMGEGRYASFLVEPRHDVKTGVYPVRVETADGISNVVLLSIGDLPELTEEESEMGALPNRNDSIEMAQTIPAAAVTVNGTLRGPERDFYRLQGKAGERRVVEVEARRVGSAVDPVVRVYDQSGKMLAKNDDAAPLGLDPRVDLKLPRDGYYYIEVHDARFSAQATNFYRLKTGSFDYPTGVFPLGGRRGEAAEVSFGSGAATVDLKDAPSDAATFVALPGSPTLPLPFDVGDYPEVREPQTEALKLPVTINGRLERAGEADRYTLQVEPGTRVAIEVRARELGTSRLMGVLAAYGADGRQLARAGDEPLPEDFFVVGQSATAGDPYLFFEVPADTPQLQIAIEDLAGRGGADYGYRIVARPAREDFRLTLGTPFVNIPAGGSVNVPVSMERRGFFGDVQLRVKNPPEGMIVEGGYIPNQNPSQIQGNRGQVRNGVLILSAKPGVKLPAVELEIEGVGRLTDGTEIVRQAAGPGMLVAVAGATLQGSVDRQRALNGMWMGMDLPASGSSALPASLAVSLESTTHKSAGDEFRFRWKWRAPKDAELPETVTMDMVSAADIRAIEMKRDAPDAATGTFLVTTTKLTQPGKYDFYVFGKVKHGGREFTVYSRPIEVVVKEAQADAAVEAR